MFLSGVSYPPSAVPSDFRYSVATQVKQHLEGIRPDRDSRTVACHDLRSVLGNFSHPHALVESLGMGKHLGRLDGLCHVRGAGGGGGFGRAALHGHQPGGRNKGARGDGTDWGGFRNCGISFQLHRAGGRGRAGVSVKCRREHGGLAAAASGAAQPDDCPPQRLVYPGRSSSLDWRLVVLREGRQSPRQGDGHSRKS